MTTKQLDTLFDRIFETLEKESYAHPEILTDPNYDLLFNSKGRLRLTHELFKGSEECIQNVKDFFNAISSFEEDYIPETFKLAVLYRDALLQA